MNDRIIVYGAGGHAKIVLATLEAQGLYQIAGLLDDNPQRHGARVYSYPVLGGREQLAPLREQGVCWAIVAVGDNQRRANLTRRLEEHGFQLASAIHPTATCLRGSHIGAGAMVLVNAFVGADVIVGEGTLVNVGVSIGHDSLVGAFAQLTPGARLGGNVRVGDFSFIGMGASVLPQVTIGRYVIIGANAVITGDLADGVTAAGVPARTIDRRATPS
ncbi:MAG: acetyltransferase [Chloroflexi bacterium]|nr:acetyltransferase [Chloroflexota bacterium]MBU1750221.1 acetyltransferase [Chloroflexota bacterium]